MNEREFKERLAYISECLECVLGVEKLYPTWLFTKYGDVPVVDIPSMPRISFSTELHMPCYEKKPFTVSLAFYSRRCLKNFIKVVKYRLAHPFKVLEAFDEILFFQLSDMLADILYAWHKEQYREQKKEILEIYNKAYEGKFFKNTVRELLVEYDKTIDFSNDKEFYTFCNRKMEKRMFEFWLGYSLTFTQGISSSSKFRLIFVHERGEEVVTEPLLLLDPRVMEKKDNFQSNIVRLFSGIFPVTKYPDAKEKKSDIFKF